MPAVLSAFLDALTVTAVIITVAAGFYSVYHKVASGKGFHVEHEDGSDEGVQELHREDLEQFRPFLRNLMMHGAVGTALGGVMTTVGEPQNLLISQTVGWDFITFFLRVAPVSIPVFFAGIATCVVVEKLGLVRLRREAAGAGAPGADGIQRRRGREAQYSRQCEPDCPGAAWCSCWFWGSRFMSRRSASSA